MPLIFSCFAQIAALAGLPPSAECPTCVVVAIDIDASCAGFQTSITVPVGTEWIRDATLWIYDPSGVAPLYGIGYIGALNRGIALGHVPDDANTGEVLALASTSLVPVASGHSAFVNNGIEQLFEGPEFQYFEFGDLGTIPSNPASPVVTFDIQLQNASEGDAFRFYIGDMTATWRAQFPEFEGGAFSTTSGGSLDSGGDAVPDGSDTVFGIDSDISVPMPPATYLVDYIDGGGTLVVVSSGIPAITTWGAVALLLAVLVVGTAAFSCGGRRDRSPAALGSPE